MPRLHRDQLAAALGATRVSVLKSQQRQRYTLTVAYPAYQVTKGEADGHGEYIDPQDLERVAWTYLAKHRQIGLYHADGTIGHGTVVESYVWRAPDWAVKDAAGRVQVVKTGDWLLGVQWDPVAWDLITSRRANGLSIQGRARKTPVPRELSHA